MFEIVYKPTNKYPLGIIEQFSRYENSPEPDEAEQVYSEEILQVKEVRDNPGVYALHYQNSLADLEPIIRLKHNAGHNKDYLKYLAETVDLISLNGTVLFDAKIIEDNSNDIEEG